MYFLGRPNSTFYFASLNEIEQRAQHYACNTYELYRNTTLVGRVEVEIMRGRKLVTITV